MTVETNYTDARTHLDRLYDQAVNDRETIVIRQGQREPVALIAVDELASLEETAYLLRSPTNSERLLGALADARQGAGQPMSLEDLRRETGLVRDRSDHG